MKKFTSLLIACSLALAGAAYAQQPEEQSTPGAGKKEKTEKAETKTHVEKTAKPTGATTEQGATTGAEQGTGKVHKGKAANAAETNVSGQTTGATTETGAVHKGKAKTESSATATETGVNAQTGATTETGTGKVRGKGRAKTETSTATGATGTSASAEASATVPPTGKHAARGEKATKTGAANAKASVAPSMTPVTAASATAAPSVAASATAAPSVAAATGQQTTGANANVAATTGAATTHVEKEKVLQVKQQTAQIKKQHVNFKAQQRADRVPPVTFTVNYRIEGSDRWSGPQYEAFRTYRSERHDRNWYHSRYHRVELIAGGYYYFNNSYWYPAWGYDPGQEYYAYDAPIYVGHRAEPPDRVIADVQAELQQMGYYQGEVDGLTGPLTRAALAAYQADQGLQVTAVMDEPTLDSLNLSS
ncbi:MAG TPA: peptidoglycan-binding domain-containing protein [Chthoniobacterales bacterium]|nr:peptidoglycan-binding domain-containing protein [Chthoniobacterales bacterium]